MLDKYVIDRIEKDIQETAQSYLCSNFTLCSGREARRHLGYTDISIKSDWEGICFKNKVRVYFSRTYPKIAPEVKDIENIIPQKKDYHVYDAGYLCLEHPLTIYQKWKPQTLLVFVDTFIRSFYHSFYYREKYGKYPFGEYAHGDKGNFQALQEFLKTENADPFYLYPYFLKEKNRLGILLPKTEMQRLNESFKEFFQKHSIPKIFKH